MEGSFAMDFTQLIFRWIHVLAGVAWIGHLYFFNWVNGPMQKALDGDAKKKVVPQMMPRALYWFRWGAMYTWITGILLLGMVYYMGSMLSAPKGMTIARGFALIFLMPALYDVLWKRVFAGKETVGVAVSFAGVAFVTWYMSTFLPPRAVFIHLGIIFGTAMFMNVWMRIWPAQQKIIAAVRDGQAPDAALAASAGLRSKHNTYMSVPLLFMMISNHYPLFYGYSAGEMNIGWILLLVLVAAGWGGTKLIYNKAGKLTGM
jgi:uncharacterized membrane protein